MKHAASRELFAYWNRVRGNAPAPERSDIEPGDIRRILADTFIVEAAGHDRYPMRLAGTRICALYGREIKGQDLLTFWNEEDAAAVSTLAGAVTEDGAAAVVTIMTRSSRGDTTPCELLLLPLRHGATAFDRILGSLAPLHQPAWLGIDPVVEQKITSLRLVRPDEAEVPLRRRTDRAVQMPHAAVVAGTEIKAGRRHGHLVVMDGGKK